MRRVIAVDLRGRGRSAAAHDSQSYRPDVELADVIAVLDHLDVERVALLGTSRGGIIGMLMAALHPGRLAGLFLNDIGAALEPAGLRRIASYLGKPARYGSWPEAGAALAGISSGFSGVTDHEWQIAARRIFMETAGGIVPHYDLRLADTFPSAETIRAGEIAALWQLMPALARLPTAILRGENSDLLERATVVKMKELLPDLAATEVPGRGHVPFLDEPQSVHAISQWLARVDKA